MWGALMDPAKKGGGWESDAFYAAGEVEIATVFDYLGERDVMPDLNGHALDFGCGIGRLSQALARRFRVVTGVDISPTMVSRATAENRYPDSCSYVLNEAEDLSRFPDRSFAFIYTSVVLQHMEPRFSSLYVGEFTRLLAPGGVAVFQVPDRVERGRSLRQRMVLTANGVRNAVGLRTRLRRGARRLGLAHGSARPGEAVVEMHCLPEPEVRGILAGGGLDLVDIRLTNSTDLAFVVGERPEPEKLFAVGGLQFLDVEPSMGFVSKQYCAVKPAVALR